MQTRCPHCQTTFRVSEAQLNAAKGKVRCGKCQQVFNAREHIHPVTVAKTDTPVTQNKKPPIPPQIDWLQQDDKTGTDHIELADASSTIADIEISDTPTEQHTAPFDTDDIEFTSEVEEPEPEGHFEAIPLAEKTPENDFAQDTDANPAEIETNYYNEISLIPGGFNKVADDIEEDQILPGIEPAYEDDTYLNAREEQGLDDMKEEIKRQLESTLEEADNEADAYDSVLNYIEDVEDIVDVKEPARDKTAAIEKIEISAPVEDSGKTVNWDDAVHHDPEVPAALRSSMQALEQKKKRPPLLTALYAGLLLLLIAGLGLQALIFRSFDMATKWPQTRATLNQVCQYLPCVYSGRRDPRKIQLVSRDVRVHPVAKHALLISATVVNQAGYAQPYPRLAIKLSDLSGDVVAEREFAPQEYLKADESKLKLLRPDIPTLISLEVLDPGSEAVNFEFRFL